VIEVSLLGPPRVERDRTHVTFETRKAVALLAVLALSERARTRDSLADLLWPDNDPDHARAALRRTLSDLRSGIGGDVLEATPDHVLLVKGPGLCVDVDRFRDLCRSGRAARAVDLFRGDFLEGLAVRQAPEFEGWVQVQDTELRRELTAALAALTHDCEEAGDLEAGVAAARRWVATDPLHEPAHQALIRLYAATGDRAAALSQYRECVRTLSRELGVPPLRETKALYEAVNLGTFVVSDRPAPRPRGAPVGEPPLVGRAEQLAVARGAYDTLDADGRVLLIEGEAGIGKTRLAEEVLAAVKRRGGRVAVGHAYEGEAGLAYAPVIEALGERLREEQAWSRMLDPRVRAEAARLVPDLGSGRASDVPGGLDGPGAESRFLSAVWETLLAAVDGDRPGALFFDDVHWADEATRALLAYGLRRLTGRPVLVVLAWRTPYDDALRHAVTAAVRAGRGLTLHLERLGPEDVRGLVRATGREDGSFDPGSLWEATEGVPLLLVEYLRGVSDPANPADPTDGAVPAGARDVLRARLAPVSETGRQVLSAAAVLGRSFDADTVRAVSGRTEDETVTALEEVVGRGLVVETAHAYDFAHHLLRRVVHDETSLARRRLLHGRAAVLPGAPDATVARHLRLAGRELEAAQAFRRAGSRARAVFANAEALAHLRAALALGHPDRSALLREIADVQVLTGDYAAALQSLEEAAALCSTGELASVEQRLGRLRQRRGDHLLAVAHLEAALAAAAEGDRRLRAEILVDLSDAVEAGGDLSRADRLAAEALELAESSGDVRAIGRARNAAGMLATARGRHDLALEHFDACLALAAESGDPELRVAAWNNAALARRSRGELEEAIRLTRQALDLCAAVGDRHREAALHNNLADLLHDAGIEEQAMEELKRAVGAFADIGADQEEPEAGIWRLVRW
jgi:DNA-binding SARP family transcriptional activator/tetratricopeptide (TPR) repeat protein